MCHGLIDKCATVPVPDLLRAVLYEKTPDDKSDDYAGSMFGSDSVLPGSSDLADDEALADIVNDHSLAVEKFDSEDVDNIIDEELGLTGSLSTWFDCIKDDLFSAADSKSAAGLLKASKLLPQDDTTIKVVVPKSRKVRKSAAVKEQIHAQHDSEMDDEAPVLIDEKRKRRMSSNRLSAQRSRQRKQDRLDELEILTAQLRLENVTLSRRSKLAEQVAKKFQSEKNALAKEVEELRRELEVIRHSRPRDLPDSEEESKDVSSGVCNMVEEGGKTISDSRILELETSSKGDSENVSMQFDAKKRNISSPDLSRAMFQELYDAIDYDQFDVSIGAEVPEEWLGSFTKCLNAGD